MRKEKVYIHCVFKFVKIGFVVTVKKNAVINLLFSLIGSVMIHGFW